MVNSRAEAFAPATIANLGVGFDILGAALGGSGDTIRVEKRAERGVEITGISGDGGKLPLSAKENVAGISALALLEAVGADFGVTMHIHKGLPLASGLGSSAASSVAAVVAVNALLERPFEREYLMPYALEGEAAVSGYHADNVAPCLLGSITLINGIKVEDIRRLPVPQNLWLALVTPAVEVKTSEARAVLPKEIPLKAMVQQTGAVAELMDALYRGDIPAMAKAMEADQVVEPARAKLMPYMHEVRQVAKAEGAYSLVISGAGPTLCAVCDSEAVALRVTQVMQNVYTDHQIASVVRHSLILTEGAHILSAT